MVHKPTHHILALAIHSDTDDSDNDDSQAMT